MILPIVLLMARIAIRTAIILLFLVFGIRLLGKRQMGQMNIYDLALIMLVANAVQNAMTAGKGNISVGIASAGTLMVLGIAMTYLIVRKPVLGRWVAGTPTVLVSNGIVMRRNMRRENITMDELNASLREHEFNRIDKVKLAVLEVDGSISIISTQK